MDLLLGHLDYFTPKGTKIGIPSKFDFFDHNFPNMGWIFDPTLALFDFKSSRHYSATTFY